MDLGKLMSWIAIRVEDIVSPRDAAEGARGVPGSQRDSIMQNEGTKYFKCIMVVGM